MRRLLTTSVFALGLASPSLAQQGALELFVGETLFVGGTRAALTWLHVEGGSLAQDGDPIANPDGIERDRDVVFASWATNLQRGLDLALVLPWISNDATFNGPSGVLSTDDGGVGDLAFVLKKRVHHDVWNRGAWNISFWAESRHRPVEPQNEPMESSTHRASNLAQAPGTRSLA